MGVNQERQTNGYIQDVVYKPLTFDLEQNLLRPNGGDGDKWFLYFSVITVNLVMLTSGADFMWMSPMSPILKSNDTLVNPLPAPLTPYQESLMAAYLPLGATLGALTLGKLADCCGKKKTILLFALLDLAAHVAVSFVDDIYCYYVSRSVQGLSFGFFVTVVPLYVSEITEDHNRGKFGSFLGIFQMLGYLYGFVVGPFFDLRYFTLACALPQAVHLVLFALFGPESPVDLASRGNRKSAKSAIKKLRDVNSREAEKSLLELERVLRAGSDKGCGQLCRSPGTTKGLIISIGVNILQQASGISAILGFLGPILDLARIEISGNAAAILVNVVQVFGGLVTMVLIERLGRRVLLLVSTSLTFLSLFFLGFYFYLDVLGLENLDRLFWMPFACLVVYVSGYSFALGPVPVVLTSELFLNDFKSAAASVSMFSSGVVASLTVFSYPIVAGYFGVMWCFWAFSALCGLGVLFVYFAVPETKGRSFLEIQKILNS